jgi:hypothetical protein
MRGWFVIACLLGAVGTARAQSANYEPLRIDTGFTGSYVGASGRGGFGGMGELKVLVHDNIAVGARFEGQLMFGGTVGNDDVQMDVAAAVAALAKGEYLFGDGPVRPFAGLGMGVYSIASQSVASGPNTAGVSQVGGRYFGIAPEVGIDLGRMRLAATYHAILGADIEVRQMVGTVEETATFSQNYWSFEMSFRIGGGRKRPPAPAILIPLPPPPP